MNNATVSPPELLPGIHESKASGIPRHGAPGAAPRGSVGRTPSPATEHSGQFLGARGEPEEGMGLRGQQGKGGRKERKIKLYLSF